MIYCRKSALIEAVMFDPTEITWPACVMRWPDSSGLQPRDTSWGYVNRPTGRKHVMSGDWIITGVNDGGFRWHDVLRPDEFGTDYVPVEVIEL